MTQITSLLSTSKAAGMKNEKAGADAAASTSNVKGKTYSAPKSEKISLWKNEVKYICNHPIKFLINFICQTLLWITPFLTVIITYYTLLAYVQSGIPSKNCIDHPIQTMKRLQNPIMNNFYRTQGFVMSSYIRGKGVRYFQGEEYDLFLDLVTRVKTISDERDVIEQFYNIKNSAIPQRDLDLINFFVTGNYSVTCDYQREKLKKLKRDCLPYEYDPSFNDILIQTPCDEVHYLTMQAKKSKQVPDILKKYINFTMGHSGPTSEMKCILLNKLTYRLAVYSLIGDKPEATSVAPETEVVKDTTVNIISPSPTTDFPSEESIIEEEIKQTDLREATIVADLIEAYKKVEKQLSRGENKTEQHSEPVVFGNENKIEDGATGKPKRATRSPVEAAVWERFKSRHFIRKRSPARSTNQNPNKRRITTTVRPTTKPPATTLHGDGFMGTDGSVTTKKPETGGYTTTGAAPDKKVLTTTLESGTKGTITTGKPGKFVSGTTPRVTEG